MGVVLLQVWEWSQVQGGWLDRLGDDRNWGGGWAGWVVTGGWAGWVVTGTGGGWAGWVVTGGWAGWVVAGTGGGWAGWVVTGVVVVGVGL